MVLESVMDVKRAEHHHYILLLFGFLSSSLALLLSLWIFSEEASILMISFIVFSTIPLVHRALKIEEKKVIYIREQELLMGEHTKILKIFMFLFIGYVLAFVFWYTILPEETVSTMFASQLRTIDVITGPTGNVVNGGDFSTIFFHNVKVLLFTLLFSVFYGAGAIFILTWNAAVIGVAIGKFISLNLGASITSNTESVAGYINVVTLGILKYMTHGAAEILAYFVAALAGGIISMAIIQGDFTDSKYRNILKGVINLVVVSILLLFIAANIEVFITPLLY
jgi:uncharacterized membrane protein SpoIIM required for sporulation